MRRGRCKIGLIIQLLGVISEYPEMKNSMEMLIEAAGCRKMSH